MPHAEQRTGHGGQGQVGEDGAGQAGGQTAVLHAHLDGHGVALGVAHVEQLAHSVAQGIAQQVVKDDHREDQQTVGEELVGVGGHHGAHDGDDGHHRDEGQDLHHGLGELAEQLVDDEAQHDGDDDDLHDAHEHIHHVDGDGLMGVEVGQRRGEEGRQHGGAGGHAHAQGHIALGQKGHHVGGGAARAGAHQDDAHGQFRAQLKDLGEQESQQRHDDELGGAAHQHILGPGEDDLEVVQLEGQAHAEHDHHEQVVDGNQAGHHVIVLAHPQKAFRHEESQHRNDEHNNGHVPPRKFAYFFQYFHENFPSTFLSIETGPRRIRYQTKEKDLCLPKETKV